MKIKHIALLSLMTFCLAFPVEAKVTGGNSSKATSSSSSIKSPASVYNNSSNNKINTKVDANKQQSLKINSGAAVITKPVDARYKPQQINTVRPTNSTIIEKKYVAPNPDNKPVRTEYVTRYDSNGRSFSLPIIIPIGVPVSNYSTQFDTYYPPTVSVGYRTVPTTIVDNTPTNGWDVLIVFGTIGGVFLIILIAAAVSRR